MRLKLRSEWGFISLSLSMDKYFYDPEDCDHCESRWIHYLGHLPRLEKVMLVCRACGSVFLTEVEAYIVEPIDEK